MNIMIIEYVEKIPHCTHVHNWLFFSTFFFQNLQAVSETKNHEPIFYFNAHFWFFLLAEE
jgi:hypothetical protein